MTAGWLAILRGYLLLEMSVSLLVELFGANHAKSDRASIFHQGSHHVSMPVRSLPIVLQLEATPIEQEATQRTSPAQSTNTAREVSALIEPE